MQSNIRTFCLFCKEEEKGGEKRKNENGRVSGRKAEPEPNPDPRQKQGKEHSVGRKRRESMIPRNRRVLLIRPALRLMIRLNCEKSVSEAK